MALLNDNEIRMNSEEELALRLHEEQDAASAEEANTSEVAMRISVLGKLVIPPSTTY